MNWKKFWGWVLAVLGVIIGILSMPQFACKRMCFCWPNCPDYCSQPWWSCILTGILMGLVLLIGGIFLLKSKNKKGGK